MSSSRGLIFYLETYSRKCIVGRAFSSIAKYLMKILKVNCIKLNEGTSLPKLLAFYLHYIVFCWGGVATINMDNSSFLSYNAGTCIGVLFDPLCKYLDCSYAPLILLLK